MHTTLTQARNTFNIEFTKHFEKPCFTDHRYNAVWWIEENGELNHVAVLNHTPKDDLYSVGLNMYCFDGHDIPEAACGIGRINRYYRPDPDLAFSLECPGYALRQCAEYVSSSLTTMKPKLWKPEKVKAEPEKVFVQGAGWRGSKGEIVLAKKTKTQAAS